MRWFMTNEHHNMLWRLVKCLELLQQPQHKN